MYQNSPDTNALLTTFSFSTLIYNLQETKTAILSGTIPTLAHPLLLDDSVRVRHSAAATLSILLEGPAQRAYLAVAELRAPHGGQPMRGFVPLSATLGGVVVGTHHALLRVLCYEQDPTVLVAVLRVLGTAPIGTPYARLPPDLLPSCIAGVKEILHRAQHAEQDPLGGLPPHNNTLLSGSLSCLAAAFGLKPPLPSVATFLASEDQGKSLSQEILSCAQHSMHSVQLEAIMALRGLAQQYSEEVIDCWAVILRLATQSLAATVPLEANFPTTSIEKVAQQSVLLLGDYLRKYGDSDTWSQGVDSCISLALAHSSPVIRAAGFGAIAGTAAATAVAVAACSTVSWSC